MYRSSPGGLSRKASRLWDAFQVVNKQRHASEYHKHHPHTQKNDGEQDTGRPLAHSQARRCICERAHGTRG